MFFCAFSDVLQDSLGMASLSVYKTQDINPKPGCRCVSLSSQATHWCHERHLAMAAGRSLDGTHGSSKLWFRVDLEAHGT